MQDKLSIERKNCNFILEIPLTVLAKRGFLNMYIKLMKKRIARTE